MKASTVIISIFISSLTFISCNSEAKKKESNESTKIEEEKIAPNPIYTIPENITPEWNVSSYFSEQEQDTLLVDLITYIYKKPNNATWKTKFDPVFRPYYINNTEDFEFVYYRVTDSTHYYYLLRPARDNNGKQQRGVGGKFLFNSNKEILEFEELFNTRILGADTLKAIGYHLFEEMIQKDNIESYIENKEIVEWPDGELFYSKEKKEWRYVE